MMKGNKAQNQLLKEIQAINLKQLKKALGCLEIKNFPITNSEKIKFNMKNNFLKGSRTMTPQ